MPVSYGLLAEPRGRHACLGEKPLDVGEKLLIHGELDKVCYATPSSPGVLYHHLFVSAYWCDETHMQPDEFERALNAIRHNVARAVESTGMGAKPFAQKNGMGETVVRDLVKAHNKDVQLSTLAKIARGSGVPLAELIDVREDAPQVPTEGELEAALLDMLPGMPKGSLDKRARYLAEAVAHALMLPQARPTSGGARRPIAPGEGAPPPEPTN